MRVNSGLKLASPFQTESPLRAWIINTVHLLSRPGSGKTVHFIVIQNSWVIRLWWLHARVPTPKANVPLIPLITLDLSCRELYLDPPPRHLSRVILSPLPSLRFTSHSRCRLIVCLLHAFAKVLKTEELAKNAVKTAFLLHPAILT